MVENKYNEKMLAAFSPYSTMFSKQSYPRLVEKKQDSVESVKLVTKRQNFRLYHFKVTAV